MRIKKRHILLTGSFFAVAGLAFGQQAPVAQPGGEPRGAPPQQQRQIQPQQQPQAQEAPRQDPAEIQAKLEELRGEVEEISLRLNEIHQKALREPEVRKSLVEYETTFNDKIGDSAPGLEAQVEAHAKVLEEIDKIGDNGEELSPREERKLEGLLAEYNQLKQQLAPVESQLFGDQELLEARTGYQEDLIAAMNEIEPKVEEIIQERMELAQTFMTLQQEFLQSQQQPGQGGAPQPGQPR